MPDSSISIGSSYQDRGFWFQPNKIDSQDERVWSGYKFLSKYFDMSKLSSTEPSYNSYDTFNVDNYMGGSFDYEIDSYKDYRDYDSVFEDYHNEIASMGSSTTGTSGYFDAYFNQDFGGSEEIAANDGFSYDSAFDKFRDEVSSISSGNLQKNNYSYDSVLDDFRQNIGAKTENNTSKSCIQLDYDKYYNSYFS